MDGWVGAVTYDHDRAILEQKVRRAMRYLGILLSEGLYDDMKATKTCISMTR